MVHPVQYTYGELATSCIVPGEPLFKDSRYGQFSSINEIWFVGTNYKAFTYPFRIGNNQMMLVGFINGYNSTKEKSAEGIRATNAVFTFLPYQTLSLKPVSIVRGKA